MKRLINSTSILSLVLYVVPPTVQAQDFLTITVEGNEVICLPNADLACPEGALCVVAETEEICTEAALEGLAELAAQGQDVSEGMLGVMSQEAAGAAQAAEDEAAAKAAEEEAARAAEEAAAAQAAAEAEAAAQAEAEAAAQAEAEAAAQAEAEAAAQAEAEAAAQAEAEAAAQAEAEAAAQAEVEAAAQAAADDEAARAAEEAAAAEAAAEAAVTEEAPTQEAAAEGEAAPEETIVADLPKVTVLDQTFICLPDETVACPEGAQCVIAANEDDCEAMALEAIAETQEGLNTTTEEPAVVEVPAEDAAAVAAAQAAAEEAAAAALADPSVQVIDAPVPTQEAVDTLETALEEPVDPQEATQAPEVEATQAIEGAEVAEDGTVTLTEDIPVSQDAQVTEEVVTEQEARSSTEEFAAAPTTVQPGKKTGLSDFEKVGLIALGALVVGSMINGNRQVVANTGDRVVVRQPDGTYQVYKDDNALLREPGTTVRTETFRDGSTRTIVMRQDGSQIVTIRDATGRVLQRVAYDKSGRGILLIDDTVAEERIDVSRLPRVSADDYVISLEDENAALRAALAAAEMEDMQGRFSLRQIRNIQEVRWLAPTVDVNNITFESGSAAIQASEAKKLAKLGRFVLEMIEENPRSLFLVEGHTDAVGSAASNLTLSDRRAESVAKALTEFFDVPPENLVVQGYGESELKIETEEDERLNRRVAVRIITNLLKRSAL